MRFTADLEKKVGKALDKKKAEQPYMHGSKVEIGIGVTILSDPFRTEVYRNGKWVCTLEELSRMIEELGMLKDAIEEEAGILL